MATTVQPQLVFVDGSFNELAQEFADYVHVGDEVRPLIEQEQQDEVLKTIVTASSALNSVPEKEFTPAYNLLVYLVSQAENQNQYLVKICDHLTKPVTSSPSNGPGLALGALTNIFNMLQPDNDARYHVFSAIVKFVKQHAMFDTLKRYLPKLDAWVQQWEIDEGEQRKLYEEIAEVAKEANDSEAAYQYVLKALRTFGEKDHKSEEAQRFALRAIKSAITSPTHYDFQDLMSIPAVAAVSDSHPVYFELLEIFAEKDLEDYNDFNEEHEGFIEKEKFDGDRLYRKMRLLTFASLAASTPTREIPYKNISKALQIPEEEIEMWTIDVIRAGLVEGRLSQQKKMFLVHRTTYRVFGEKQWRELGDRIDGWRATLKGVAAALRREQISAEVSRKREQEEVERKLAGAGLDDSKGRRGGDLRRGGGGDRPPPKPRNDDDD